MLNEFKKSIIRLGMLLPLLLAGYSRAVTLEPLCSNDRLLGEYVLQTSANSDSGTYSDGLAYYVDSSTNTAAVAQGSFSGAALVIPSSYNGLSVTGVMASGFASFSALSSVSFPTSITLIGSQAFKGTGLTSVEIPGLVTSLSPSTFMDCRSLSKVTWATRSSASVTDLLSSIGDYCFCGDILLASFSFPAGLQSIGACAFAGCLRLPRAIFRAVTISSVSYGLTSIGKGAFSDCPLLGLVFFPSTMNSGSVGDYAFKNDSIAKLFISALPTGYASTGTLWNYVQTSGGTSSYVPITLGKSDMSYADGYYYSKYLTSDPATDYDVVIYLYVGTSQAAITIGPTLSDEDGVHRVVGIDNEAFSGHSELTDVIFSANLGFINSKAFYGCTGLQSLNFSAATDLKTIGTYAFFCPDSSSNLTQFTTLDFPANIVSIGNYAFGNYGYVSSITFENSTSVPSKLTTIGDQAFLNLGYRRSVHTSTLLLPGSLTSIGTSAFENAQTIATLRFLDPSAATTLIVKANAFKNLYYLTSLTFSSNSNSTWRAYSNGDQNTFALDSPNYTYNGATLHSVIIPSQVTLLGGKTFLNRARLSVYCVATSQPSAWPGNWNLVSGTTTVGDTSGLQGNYYAPAYWNVSSSGKALIRYALTSGGTTLFDFVETSAGSGNVICSRYYFDGSSSASLSPSVPSSFTNSGTTYTVTAVGYGAFFWSTINSNSSTKGAFTSNTSSLSKAILPDSITSIGDYAFAATGTLREISSSTSNTYYFPNALTSIGLFAFAFTGLTAAYLPGTLTSLGESTVGASPFTGCFLLTTLAITSSNANQTYYSDSNVIYKRTAASNYGECLTMASWASYSDGLSIAWGCTQLDKMSFRGQRKVTKISLPYTLTSIGSYFIDSIGDAYDTDNQKGYSSLQSVRFYTNDTTGYPSALCSKIEAIAFWGCSTLTTCELPAGLTAIEHEAFYQCTNLQYFPMTSAASDTGTAGALNLSATGLTKFGYAAFKGCSKIASLTTPTSFTTFDDASNDNNLGGAFQGCTGLKSISLNSGCTTIGRNSFRSCTNSAFTSLTLPSSVTTVGTSAFLGDTALKTVSLSSGLTSLGDQAFSGCTKLSSLTFLNGANALTITGGAFNGCTSLTNQFIPKGASFTFSDKNYPFLNCSTNLKLFLDCKGTEYDTNQSSKYPDGFNYRSTATSNQVIPTYCHCSSNEEKSAQTSIGAWHWTSGGTVMTIGVGADS